MLTYMPDTDISIYVMKNYPMHLREKFNALAEQLSISSITLGELHYGTEKSSRRVKNLMAEHFVAPRSTPVRRQGSSALRSGPGRTATRRRPMRPARHADRRATLKSHRQSALNPRGHARPGRLTPGKKVPFRLMAHDANQIGSPQRLTTQSYQLSKRCRPWSGR
jgi:predicted nucleic acid-binding protein